MRINLAFLTFALIILIIYLLFYQVIPSYKKALSLVKDYNSKQIQKEKILSLKKQIEELESDPIFQELLKNREKFNSYLPDSPLVEGIIYDLVNHYQLLNLSKFPGLTYRLQDSDLKTPVELPLKPKVVEFSFRDSMNYPILVSLIKLLESNIRVFAIENIKISKDERKQILDVDLTVDSYYFEK